MRRIPLPPRVPVLLNFSTPQFRFTHQRRFRQNPRRNHDIHKSRIPYFRVSSPYLNSFAPGTWPACLLTYIHTYMLLTTCSFSNLAVASPPNSTAHSTFPFLSFSAIPSPPHHTSSPNHNEHQFPIPAQPSPAPRTVRKTTDRLPHAMPCHAMQSNSVASHRFPPSSV